MNALPKQEAGQPVDTITVLQAKPGLAMTKTYSKEGVAPYSLAKFFTPRTRKVDGIHKLHDLLVELEGKPRCCIIRGEFKGAEHAATIEGAVDGPDLYLRKKKLYDDLPKHFCLIDVDGFIPTANPMTDTEAAIDEYIRRHLPDCFHDVTYHWQLSASAGTPGKEHLLKAHLWFWLETPYTSAQMNAWAKTIGPAVDSAVFRTVQVHYTANPIFKDGVADPVPSRSGLVEGWMGDTVPLEINEVLLLRATEEEDEDHELVDPTEKPGVIGAFHRAFTAEDVLEDFLADEFQFEEGSDRRITWLNGGGTPGGCFLSDDRMHVGSVHNTDPLDNRLTNLFDLVRHYKFGELDEGLDEFEILDMRDKPSYNAMCAWASSLPEVQAELEKGKAEEQTEAVSIREQLVARIAGATSEAELREEVCLAVQKNYKDLESADVSILADAVKKQFSALGVGSISKEDAKRLMQPPRRELAKMEGLPRWAQGYVYVTSRAQIFRYDSNEWLSREAFEFKHNADAGTDDEGGQVSAYTLLRDLRQFPKVEQALYMPHMGATFNIDGVSCVNTYRPSSVPETKPRDKWTAADQEAVMRCERHIEVLCNERAPVKKAIMDWLAFCAQFPGQKVNYTWLIVGGEGAGKTWVSQLMSVVMGGPNVRVVSVKEVLSDFNGWAEGAAFAAIEEIRIHGHRQDAWDNLKPVLTNPTIPIIKKGRDGYNAPNVTNYILFSNHFDAVPVSLGARRVGVIHTPFDGDKTKELLDAMAVKEGFKDGGAYFDMLFGVLDRHGPAIREWLTTWSIDPAFNPKGRAPETDERTAMAMYSMSHEEDTVRAVVEAGGPWVTPEVVNPGKLQTLVEMWEDGGVHVSEEKLTFHLRKMGYQRYGRLKHEGKTIRVWVKGDWITGNTSVDNDTIRHLLKTSEQGGTPEEDFLK